MRYPLLAIVLSSLLALPAFAIDGHRDDPDFERGIASPQNFAEQGQSIRMGPVGRGIVSPRQPVPKLDAPAHDSPPAADAPEGEAPKPPPKTAGVDLMNPTVGRLRVNLLDLTTRKTDAGGGNAFAAGIALAGKSAGQPSGVSLPAVQLISYKSPAMPGIEGSKGSSGSGGGGGSGGGNGGGGSSSGTPTKTDEKKDDKKPDETPTPKPESSPTPTKGKDGKDGKDGTDGKEGKQGKDGKDGKPGQTPKEKPDDTPGGNKGPKTPPGQKPPPGVQPPGGKDGPGGGRGPGSTPGEAGDHDTRDREGKIDRAKFLKVLGFDPQRAAYLQQHDDGGPGDLLRQLDGVSDAKLTELDDTLKAARGAVKRKTMGAEVFEKKVRESYREAMGEKKDGDTPIVGEEEYVSRAKESLEPKEGK